MSTTTKKPKPMTEQQLTNEYRTLTYWNHGFQRALHASRLRHQEGREALKPEVSKVISANYDAQKAINEIYVKPIGELALERLRKDI